MSVALRTALLLARLSVEVGNGNHTGTPRLNDNVN